MQYPGSSRGRGPVGALAEARDPASRGARRAVVAGRADRVVAVVGEHRGAGSRVVSFRRWQPAQPPLRGSLKRRSPPAPRRRQRGAPARRSRRTSTRTAPSRRWSGTPRAARPTAASVASGSSSAPPNARAKSPRVGPRRIFAATARPSRLFISSGLSSGWRTSVANRVDAPVPEEAAERRRLGIVAVLVRSETSGRNAGRAATARSGARSDRGGCRAAGRSSSRCCRRTRARDRGSWRSWCPRGSERFGVEEDRAPDTRASPASAARRLRAARASVREARDRRDADSAGDRDRSREKSFAQHPRHFPLRRRPIQTIRKQPRQRHRARRHAPKLENRRVAPYIGQLAGGDPARGQREEFAGFRTFARVGNSSCTAMRAVAHQYPCKQRRTPTCKSDRHRLFSRLSRSSRAACCVSRVHVRDGPHAPGTDQRADRCQLALQAGGATAQHGQLHDHRAVRVPS